MTIRLVNVQAHVSIEMTEARLTGLVTFDSVQQTWAVVVSECHSLATLAVPLGHCL